jgi:hypothetical protein
MIVCVLNKEIRDDGRECIDYAFECVQNCFVWLQKVFSSIVADKNESTSSKRETWIDVLVGPLLILFPIFD